MWESVVEDWKINSEADADDLEALCGRLARLKETAAPGPELEPLMELALSLTDLTA